MKKLNTVRLRKIKKICLDSVVLIDFMQQDLTGNGKEESKILSNTSKAISDFPKNLESLGLEKSLIHLKEKECVSSRILTEFVCKVGETNV